ncbi:saccharopine dehydrogenase-like oxidoreductase [Diadema antillarum]|uniref:saccharopine dehydrogenase-like oxidoreductase n=1 Tax=Diadema antillarum TaxID=105358 RepID=UPI003A8B41F1
MAAPSKKYDLVVFGASGFTGQFVVEELARHQEEEPALTWAVAGRNLEKLESVVAQAATVTDKDLSKVGMIKANVHDMESLNDMCSQAVVILNCVGPYRFFGEQVVRACIESGCHHVDISGEPQFLEGIQVNYGEKAKEAGVYVVGACGFDSIPADMGVLYTKQQFKGILNTVEGYLSFNSGSEGFCGHYATWQSAIHGFANAKELATLRKGMNNKPLPKYTPRLTRRPQVFFSKDANKWSLMFPGADASVVRRTQRFLYEKDEERPIQFGAYMTVGSLFWLIVTIFFGAIFSFLAKYKTGRNLLEKYPTLFSGGGFSHAGPTRKQMEGSSFSITFQGEGFTDEEAEKGGKHNTKITTQVKGPEPGYVATPIVMIHAALVILDEQEKLPKGGGVFTPGAAFAKTSLLERLNKHNVEFSVVSAQTSI